MPGGAEPGSPGAVLLAQAPRGHELLQQRAEDNLGGFGQGKTACTTCDLLPQSPSRAPLNASMTNTNISC